MEQVLNLHIERLPEGLYLATSEEVSGLVAQGRTVIETLEIARDVARKILEAKEAREGSSKKLSLVKDCFEYPLIVGT